MLAQKLKCIYMLYPSVCVVLYLYPAVLRQLAAFMYIFSLPPIMSPSSVSRSNPRATMPTYWGFPFPFSPDLLAIILVC